jgi:methylmalonyl-CoA/ethylmalonyl-CoA epimerase
MIVMKNDTPGFLSALSDPDKLAREAAAARIFALGCRLARPVVDRWLADEEVARCFVLGGSGEPQETVGLAVEPGSFERIRSAFGSPPLADVPPDQDAREFEIECPAGVRLDILTTREPGGSGAIARFLQKFGEGIQQVEILVKNVDGASQILRERFGIEFVFPATRAGANATRVNFFLVSLPAGGKVLMELVEAKARPHSL